MVRRGLSEENGSWNTICIRRRSVRWLAPRAASTSSPAKRTEPAVGSIRRRANRATVDLPQPLSPHQAERLAGLHGELHPVDRAHGGGERAGEAAALGEMLHQAVDLQQGSHRPAIVGSVASRNPSPTMLRPSTSSRMAMPGKMESHGASRMFSNPSAQHAAPTGGWRFDTETEEGQRRLGAHGIRHPQRRQHQHLEDHVRQDGDGTKSGQVAEPECASGLDDRRAGAGLSTGARATRANGATAVRAMANTSDWTSRGPRGRPRSAPGSGSGNDSSTSITCITDQVGPAHRHSRLTSPIVPPTSMARRDREERDQQGEPAPPTAAATARPGRYSSVPSG